MNVVTSKHTHTHGALSSMTDRILWSGHFFFQKNTWKDERGVMCLDKNKESEAASLL